MSTDTQFINPPKTTVGRHRLTDALNRLLADTFTLYLIYRNFQWNVSSPQFHGVHRLFAEHYHDLEGALDEIAERIRALGSYAASSYREYLELASIHDMDSSIGASKMVEHVVYCHNQIMATAREVYHLAQEACDIATADLAQERMGMHDKGAWVLKDFASSQLRRT